MRLIVLYGAPGVGKLTVARNLAPLMGAKIFHNHLVIDVVEPIVTRRYPGFTPFVYDLQRQILVAAMKAKAADVVFTFAFSVNEKEAVDLLNDLVAIGSQQDVEVILVYLTCDRTVLRQRLAHDSRKEHGKLTDVAHLDEMFRLYDLVSPHPLHNHLHIDTTDLSSAETAERIISLL